MSPDNNEIRYKTNIKSANAINMILKKRQAPLTVSLTVSFFDPPLEIWLIK